MANFKDDTADVKREFEGLSNSTQIFVWSMVAIGVLIGVLLGGLIAYGIAAEEVDGRQCIEFEDELYCAEGDAAGDTEDADG